MPGPRSGVFELVGEPEKSSCRIDVAGLRRHDENGIDPIHRNDAHDAAKSTFGLSLQYPLELAGPLCRIAVADRKEGIGLTCQNVDIESPDETDQGLADRGVPGDDYRVGRRVGGNFPALCNIGFEHLGKILGRGVTQRHDLGTGAYRVRAGDKVAGRTRGQRDHGVDPIPFDQRRTIRVEQGFERRYQRRTLHRGAGLDGPGAMHVRVDRVVQVECSPENRAHDLPYVGVDKIEGYIAGLSGGRARTRRWNHGRFRGAGRDKGTLPAAIGGDRTVYSGFRSLQVARLLQRLQTRLRRQLTISQQDEGYGGGERPNGVPRVRHLPLLAQPRCPRRRAGRNDGNTWRRLRDGRSRTRHRHARPAGGWRGWHSAARLTDRSGWRG